MKKQLIFLCLIAFKLPLLAQVVNGGVPPGGATNNTTRNWNSTFGPGTSNSTSSVADSWLRPLVVKRQGGYVIFDRKRPLTTAYDSILCMNCEGNDPYTFIYLVGRNNKFGIFNLHVDLIPRNNYTELDWEYSVELGLSVIWDEVIICTKHQGYYIVRLGSRYGFYQANGKGGREIIDCQYDTMRVKELNYNKKYWAYAKKDNIDYEYKIKFKNSEIYIDQIKP